MMPPLWVLLWSVLPGPALLSGSDHCGVHESSSSRSHSVSPSLESLRCYNDYESHVDCSWRRHRNTTLELWFNTAEGRKLCEPYNATAENDHCRYKTEFFSIGKTHTVFFLKNKTRSVCSSVPRKSQDLFQQLRARPPVNLSTHHAGDGGRRLRWSSPYPASSSLDKNLTYQLSYRTQSQDNWTTEDVANTSVTLERRLLLPGCRYEARVRARASVGQWSDWSPVVTWQTKEDFGQPPTLHCVLDGEREVTCSWEVSRELAHFITYQLACRHNQTAPSERCCVNATVRSGLGGMRLRYSCSLTVADPEHLQLDLLPAHNAKTFKAREHIRPRPPQQVDVSAKDNNWIVDWREPTTDSVFQLSYQVCYYRTHSQESPVLLNISAGSMSVTILGKSLAPSQGYQVKVRSLVAPGDSMSYKGIPSEWTDPVDWTSNEATWSSTTLIYILISVVVTVVFLTLYCTISDCHRKIILWVDSVPSPAKSKILSDIKSATSRTLMQSEKTSICKVQHLCNISPCSSDAALWSTKNAEKKCVGQDEGCWSCDNLSSPDHKVNSSNKSSVSFSGPYILCQSSESTPVKPVSVKSDVRDKEIPPDVSASPSPERFTLLGEGYVCLPSRSISRSTQELVSHSSENTNPQEDQQQCPESKQWLGRPDVPPDLGEPTSGDQPPDYTPEHFTSWPHGGTIQASGYCHLPARFITAAK